MFRELASQSPIAARVLAELDEQLRSLSLPTLGELAWNDSESLGRDLFSTQLSVLLADVFAFRVLHELGIRPDVISDHSYGEYAAMVAAGAWSLETAIQATRRRCKIINSCESARGVLLSTSASWEQSEQFVQEVGGELFLANGNAPDQTVIGGRTDEIERLSARMTEEGLTTQVIPVPAPFHTPLMAECQPLFRAAVAGLSLRPPTTPLLSSVTNRYVADPNDLRDNLVDQFVRPVRFVELSQRLVADGCDFLIEAGPRQVVSRLLRRCVPSSDVSIIAFDNPKRPGMEALLRVQALFEVRGGVCEASKETTSASSHRSAITVRRNKAVAERAPTRPIFFDATTARREKRQQTIESTVASPAATAEPANEVRDELQSLLVNFVCEQTGYPPELVTMDADLEADLGIDSIKKAQLLGELREQFVFQQAPGNLSLSDFPTLRHIYDFLKDSPRRDGNATSTAPAKPDSSPAPQRLSPVNPPNVVAVSSAHQPASNVVAVRERHDAREDASRPDWHRLNVAFIRGSRFEMGRRHGERERETIRKLIDAYAAYFDGKVHEVTPLEQALERKEEFIPPDGLEELRGLAEGSQQSLDRLVSFNFGLGFEQFAGCSQLAIPARLNGRHGLIHAVNEDLMLGMVLGDKLRRLVQVRDPDDGLPHVLFSTSGQLGGLNGFNQAGLCITSTLLIDRFHPGVPNSGWLHAHIVQTLLQQTASIPDAVRLLREMPRCGAWSLCLSDRNADRLMYLEYDGDQLWERTPTNGCFFSTNHALLAEHLQSVPHGSRHRYERLDEIFSSNGHDGHSAEFVQSILNDVFDRERGRVVRHPTMNTIRRSDTQASIVMCPGSDEVWVAQNFKAGPETPREFTRLSMSELFESADQAEESSEPADGRVMHRFVLRTVEQPLPDMPTSTWNLYGPVVILGQGKLAAELTRRLSSNGLSVASLPITANSDTAVAVFEKFASAECPLSVLIADEAVTATDETYLPQALTVHRVLQAWLSRLPEDQLVRGTLVGLTNVGSDFGWTSPVLHPASGGIAGLCKALQREFTALRVLVLDAPVGEPAQLVATALQRELDAETHDLEVSWIRQRRRAVRIVERRPRPLAEAAPRRGGSWIVTGGARGITFAVARELAKRYELKLHLLGSSPLPQVDDASREAFATDPKGLRTRTIREARQGGAEPNAVWKNLERSLEIDRNLRQLNADGIAATYHACDVADGDALARVLDEVRRIDGSIHGVLHGAGVEEGSRFTRKRPDRVASTLNVKVGGALHLIRLLENDPLEHFVAFGSISGRFGNVGQSDYSMASDWLAKVVGRLRTQRPGVAATTFHWPAWDEVGMAARPESRVVLEAAGSRFLPLAEGCAYVVEELEAGCPEAEVLIFEDAHRFDLPGQVVPPDSPRRLAAERRATEFRLLTGVKECSSDSLVAESRLDPTRDVFLLEHQFAGTAILPGAVGLELIAEAASLLMRRDPNGVADFEIVNGLRFPEGRPLVVQVRATRRGRQVHCEMTADFFHRAGTLIDPQRVFVRGTVLFDAEPFTTRTITLPSMNDWKPAKYRTLGESVMQSSIYHGPNFQCLCEWSRDGDFWFAKTHAAMPAAVRGSRQGSRWLLPSVLLDGCFQIAAVSRRLGSIFALSLPHGMSRLRWSRLPVEGEVCLIRARVIEQDERQASFAIELATTDGEVLLELDRYRTITPPGAEPAPTNPNSVAVEKSMRGRSTVAGRETR
jgi:malonyl CoA-acyl carrier protein transacylase/NAD(P)-dependent dehydrogenase (short-subunit alcohol dehydrogenase family)/predicted choloylglycine hydrolase